MDLFNISSHYSLYGNNKIKKILNIFIKNKYNIINPTFKKLYDLTKKKLFVVATDVESGLEKIFSVDDTPNICICDAICASSAIPFIFPYKEIGNSKYIDGAFINSYPINLFKNDLDNTIGINMRSHTLKNTKINDVMSYALNLYDLTLNSLGSNTTNLLNANIYIEICRKHLNINTYIDNLDSIVDETYKETKEKLG
tara:strand:- start:730 stop:1323 length:594 start_codon:yes stop_codon:yes gene_type:complete